MEVGCKKMYSSQTIPQKEENSKNFELRKIQVETVVRWFKQLEKTKKMLRGRGKFPESDQTLSLKEITQLIEFLEI